MSFAWLSSRFFAATKTRLLPPLAWCVSTQGQKCRLGDRLTRNAPCSRMWADPPHHPTRPEPSPPATSLKGHQRPKSPDSTSGGLGSTAVHPLSCGNRQQWGMGRPSASTWERLLKGRERSAGCAKIFNFANGPFRAINKAVFTLGPLPKGERAAPRPPYMRRSPPAPWAIGAIWRNARRVPVSARDVLSG